MQSRWYLKRVNCLALCAWVKLAIDFQQYPDGPGTYTQGLLFEATILHMIFGEAPNGCVAQIRRPPRRSDPPSHDQSTQPTGARGHLVSSLFKDLP